MNPLRPSSKLLCKLGSLIIHADEVLSPDGRNLDKDVFFHGLFDPDVQEWLKAMDKMAMLPKKRTDRR